MNFDILKNSPTDCAITTHAQEAPWRKQARMVSDRLLNDSLESFTDLGLTSHEMSRLSGFPLETVEAGLKRMRDVARTKSPSGSAEPVKHPTERPVDCLRSNAKVLLAEKDVVVATDLASDMADRGLRVTAVATTVSGAIDWLATNELDFALLNVRLYDGYSYPVAAQLAASGIPFAFFTSCERTDILPEFRNFPYLTKPQAAEVVADYSARILERGLR